MRLISGVLLDEAILVMTADHRIGQIQVFNDGLKFSRMIFADFSTKDDGEFVGLPDVAIRVHQSLAEPVHSSAARKDPVVAKLDLGEEQSVFYSR